MNTMKAAVLTKQAPVDTSPLRVEAVPVPAMGVDDVLIRVHACGVCRTDLHVVEGDLAPRKMPIIPGHQVVGIVEEAGANVRSVARGERVGAAWLRSTCGQCRFCTSGRENLCERAEFNGWTADGGFAQFMAAPARFVYTLPGGFSDTQAAPLLCAGIIGYRAMKLTGLDQRRDGWKGAKLGIYGFGAAGHVVIQLARGRGAQVYVCTRDHQRHQSLARELGAAWTGNATEPPPEKLDAAIIFAPAGEIVPAALGALDKGGVLVLGGIYMSDIPQMEYRLLYGERVIRTVANNTREDGQEFLNEAAALPVRTHVQVFAFDRVNEALQSLKNDAIRGAAVIKID
jgi:propanol-preferring alcohol dehydrogenase